MMCFPAALAPLMGSGAGIVVVLSLAACAIIVWRSARFRNLAFTVWVFVFAATALLFPDAVTHLGSFQYKQLIVPLIQLIMLGMGMTLTLADFARVARMPRGVLIGVALQYLMMPLMGVAAARAFGLEAEVAVGLILVGSCAGGVASNVIAYIAGANVALSVTMTAFSTLLSPLATPLAMKLHAGQYVPIEVGPMMWAIGQMIVLPVIVGVLVNRYLPRLATGLVRFLPFVSMLGICIIIAVTIGLSRDELLAVGLALLGASVCHNAAGFTFGYLGARMFGLAAPDARTVAIEVGMQNGGMATGLAFNVLQSEVAALASAVFGPWSALAGSALASWWRNHPAIDTSSQPAFPPKPPIVDKAIPEQRGL